jgi:hypothetical protein
MTGFGVTPGVRRDRLLNRAVVAGSAVVAAAVVATGVFVSKVAHSGVGSTGAAVSTQNGDQGGFGLPGGDGGNQGGVVPNQNNQAPVGGSHGS